MGIVVIEILYVHENPNPQDIRRKFIIYSVRKQIKYQQFTQAAYVSKNEITEIDYNEN